MVLNTSHGLQQLATQQQQQQPQPMQTAGVVAAAGAGVAGNSRVGTPNAQTVTSVTAAPVVVAGMTSQLDSPIVTTALTRHPHQEDLYMATR